jgi:hypothetical protein
VKDRIQVRVVKSSEAPKLVDPRSKTLPILILLGGLIATAAVAFTRDNLVRSDRARELTAVSSHDGRDKPDTSAGAPPTRSAPRPVPRPDPSSPPQETAPTITVSRGRSTLGSVPRNDAPTTRERDIPDEGRRQARQS